MESDFTDFWSLYFRLCRNNGWAKKDALPSSLQDVAFGEILDVDYRCTGPGGGKCAGVEDDIACEEIRVWGVGFVFVVEGLGWRCHCGYWIPAWGRFAEYLVVFAMSVYRAGDLEAELYGLNIRNCSIFELNLSVNVRAALAACEHLRLSVA